MPATAMALTRIAIPTPDKPTQDFVQKPALLRLCDWRCG
jgi:hypothetical protein